MDTTESGRGVATKLYKVSGIPTQHVIDRDGSIVTSFVGYVGLTSALEKTLDKAARQSDANRQE